MIDIYCSNYVWRLKMTLGSARELATDDSTPLQVTPIIAVSNSPL
jgi:hypothetical protein